MKMPKEELVTAESEILELLQNHPDGVTNEELVKMTASLEGKIRGETVNNLLSSGKIEMLPGTKQGSFSLRIRRGTQITDASAEEQLVAHSALCSTFLSFPFVLYEVTLLN